CLCGRTMISVPSFALPTWRHLFSFAILYMRILFDEEPAMSTVRKSVSPADPVATSIQHLRSILEQTEALEALLSVVGSLPIDLDVDVLLRLHCIDTEMGRILHRLAQAGPEE